MNVNVNVEFVDYDRSFLDLSFKWLSDKEIKFLTNTPVLSKEKQEQWFVSLPKKTDYYIKGILADGKAIGACGLKRITDTDGEYWGYIGEKEYWHKGIGKQMMSFIERYAYSLGLKQIYLLVIPDNMRAIRLYGGKGYKEVERIDGMIKMCKQL